MCGSQKPLEVRLLLEWHRNACWSSGGQRFKHMLENFTHGAVKYPFLCRSRAEPVITSKVRVVRLFLAALPPVNFQHHILDPGGLQASSQHRKTSGLQNWRHVSHHGNVLWRSQRGCKYHNTHSYCLVTVMHIHSHMKWLRMCFISPAIHPSILFGLTK